MTGVLITGATGNVGSHLMKTYLEETNSQVHAVVRAESAAHANRRVSEVLDFWDVPLEKREGRVHAYRGDVVLPGLGLGKRELEAIRASVQMVVHAASNLRLDLPEATARLEILGATKNVLAIARSLETFERFGFMSTMEVMGRYEDVVREERLTHHRIQFMNTYEQCKFEAEEFLGQQIAEGCPVTIFRPSMVVGETTTGKVRRFQTFYLMTERLVLSPSSRFLPADAPLDVIPLDLLSNATLALMKSPRAVGSIYHLSQGLEDRMGFVPYAELVRPIAARRLGRQIPKPLWLPPEFFRALLRALCRVTTGRIRRKVGAQLILLEFFGLPWQFDNKKTQAELRSHGIAWPRLRDYLPTLLNYYFAHRRGRRQTH